MPSKPVRAAPPTLPPWVPRGATRVLLIVYLALALLGGFLTQWGPESGRALFAASIVDTRAVLHGEVWRLVSGGLVNVSGSWGLLFGLITIFFFTPDVASRWGGKKLTAVLFGSYILAYTVNVLVGGAFLLLPQESYFQRMAPLPLVYGPMPAMTALVAAWAREFPDRPLRFFFVPMLGKHLYWFEIVMLVLHVFFVEAGQSGNLALFVGLGLATLVSGTPSPARSLYLKLRLGSLRREKDAVERALKKAGAPARKPGSPDLRVVRGGADDEPPKDKRYLN
jgi:hypothetical protein